MSVDLDRSEREDLATASCASSEPDLTRQADVSDLADRPHVLVEWESWIRLVL
jgi:hypothetical protein